MKIALLLTVITILAGPATGFAERPGEKDIIQAFLGCPEIIEAQKEFKDSAVPGEIRILMYESLCGAVGCQSSAIVAWEYQRDKANPFTSHILGRVHIGIKGNILRVERVMLVPFQDIGHQKNMTKKY